MWKSCVYKITVGDETYIGSTCNLTNRFIKHKHSCYNPDSRGYNFKLYKYIREHSHWDNIKVEILVYLHPKFNKAERCTFEQEWIDYINPTLNDYKAYTGLNKKEYKKQSYIDNKEQIKIQMKQYRIDNKDKIKQYYTENKDYKNARKREKIKCNHCDDIVSRNSMSMHVRRKHN